MVGIVKTFAAGLVGSVIVFIWASANIVEAQGRPPQGPSKFDQDDKNKDGKLSRSEFSGPDRAFDRLDEDGDGFITRAELRKARENRPHDPQETGDDREPCPDLVVERYVRDKVWDGNVIFVDGNRRRVVEVDLQGEVVWECPVPVSGSTALRACGCAGRVSDVSPFFNAHRRGLEDHSGT